MQKPIGSIPVSLERGDQKEEDGIHSSYSSGRSGTYIPPLLREGLQPISESSGRPTTYILIKRRSSEFIS